MLHQVPLKLLCLMVAAVAFGSVIAPAAVGAPAEQFVVEFVDEPVPWEFDDPCTGEAVHGVGFESGVVRSGGPASDAAPLLHS